MLDPHTTATPLPSNRRRISSCTTTPATLLTVASTGPGTDHDLRFRISEPLIVTTEELCRSFDTGYC